MSTPYNPGYGQSPMYLLPKVNYGWIGESWNLYRKAMLPWFLLFLLPVLTYILLVAYVYTSPQMLSLYGQMRSGTPVTPGTMPVQQFSTTLITYGIEFVYYIVMFVASCCGSDIALRQVRGEDIPINSIFRGLRNALQMFIFFILFGIATFVGFLGCCIGVYVSYGLLFPGMALVADGESGTNAITRSFDGMKGDWLNAALFMFVFYLLLSFGILFTCLIGSFALFPMVYIISALAYRDMIGMPTAGGTGMLGAVARPAPWQQSGQPNPGQPGVWPPAPSAGQQPYGQQSYGQQQPYGQQPPSGQSPFGQPPSQGQSPFGQPPPNQSPFGQPPAPEPREPQDPNQGL